MLRLLSTPDALRLREFLREAGYTEKEFSDRPMLQELPSLRSGNAPYLIECTRELSTINTLLRLFFLGMPVEAQVASSTMPRQLLALMVESGMVSADGDRLAPQVMLSPGGEYIFAADTLGRMTVQSSDLVLWPNQTSRALQHFSITRPSQATLDLGAGCGILSLLLAPQSVRVAATDLNPRAAEFIEFNAKLNGVENIQTYTGDTFEPVSGQRFDLIVANPPFFVGPSSERMFCENPMELDRYCRRVAQEAARHLNDGGFFQMICEWVHVRGQSWTERIAEWVEGSGCDAWVARTHVSDVAAYAFERTRDEYAISPEATSAKYAEWMAYYREREVEEIHCGLLAMRRRSGQNWFRCEEALVSGGTPFGDAVIRIFETQDVLSAHVSDDGMLSLKPELDAAAQLERDFHLHDRQWTPASQRLTLKGGLPASLAVEFPVAQFLARCDGRRTLGELIHELAGLVKADAGQVQQQCCAVVRKLAERRFLRL